MIQLSSCSEKKIKYNIPQDRKEQEMPSAMAEAFRKVHEALEKGRPPREEKKGPPKKDKDKREERGKRSGGMVRVVGGALWGSGRTRLKRAVMWAEPLGGPIKGEKDERGERGRGVLLRK